MKYYSISHDFNGRKIKRKKAKGAVYAKYTPPPFKPLTSTTSPSYADIRMAETSRYNSVDIKTTSGICAKPDPKKYTGSLVKGISTMHKSNAVPIIDEKEAKEHASMRR